MSTNISVSASLSIKYTDIYPLVGPLSVTMTGISAHQKLDLLASLVRLLNYEGLAVFGDCFDEVRELTREVLRSCLWDVEMGEVGASWRGRARVWSV